MNSAHPSPGTRRRPARARLIGLGFRLLYNELAWLYDPVSWIVSLGRWRRWQETALRFLPEGRDVLEVGFGPGHLLLRLARAGRRPVGLDVSAHMLRLAGRRLRRRGAPARLTRGHAAALPFAERSFDAVVLTFPTPFVYNAVWLGNVARVLRPGGRLVVVEAARFTRRTLVWRLLDWLYRVTGQHGPVPDLPSLLGGVGLRARREDIPVDGTSVGLVIADTPD